MAATIWNVSNAEYHAATDRIGSSMLQVILESPAQYYRKYIGKDADGQPLDFEHLYYRGDAFQYRLRIDRQKGAQA